MKNIKNITGLILTAITVTYIVGGVAVALYDFVKIALFP